MEKKAHVRSFSRGSLDSSSDCAPSKPERLVGLEHEDAARQQRPRGSVNTFELYASGRVATSAVRERQGSIDIFATLPRRVQGSPGHFATLPKPHPSKSGPPSSEEKRVTEQTAIEQKAMSSNITSLVAPVQNSVPSTEAEKTVTTTSTTTSTITSTIWPQDTKFVSLDALESFNKQLQMLADAEVDNEVDFNDKVISGLQEKIDELHDTILKVEHNGQLSVKMAEQRALEAETKLQIMTERVQKSEQRCVWLTGRCKYLETALQKTAILQERDRAISQRNHTPQKVPSVRDLENMAPPPPHVQNYTARPEHRNHLSGRQAERSPPQTLRSDSIPTHGEPHLNRSLALDQSPGQHSERITPQQGQQYDWNPARCPSTEWNPNLSQTMRNPTQSQTVVRNPNQYGQAMHGTVQSQASDRNPATGNYKPFTQDKGQSTTQQNGGAIFSTETTV